MLTDEGTTAREPEKHTQKVFVTDLGYENRQSGFKAPVLIPTLYHILSSIIGA